MEKLELHHIAKRLPYGLKFQSSIHQFKYKDREILKMNGLCIDANGELNIEFLHKDELCFSNEMNPVKPILRPLSDLTKEIEHDGETFIPIVEIFKEAYKEVYNYYPEIEKGELTFFEPNGMSFTEIVKGEEWRYGFSIESHQILLSYDNAQGLTINQFALRDKLLEWHFDVDGLIEKGIGIDVNSLKTNPYE